MKKTLTLYLTLLLTLMLASVAVAGPKAVPSEPVFTFSSVPEGEKLNHEFIIQNQGDTPLEITDVVPP